MSAPNPYTDFWFAALGSPMGIYLTTSDPVALKTQLYTARRACGSPLLEGVSIRTSPANPTGELWLVKVEASSAPPPEE